MKLAKVLLQESESGDKLAMGIYKAIDNIDPNLNYKDFASAVATVIKNEYGTHNIQPFMKELHSQLGIQEGTNEGWNDHEVKEKLSKVDFDMISSYFNNKKFSAPHPDDSLRQINGERDWNDWKEGTLKRWGDVNIKLDNTAVWFDQVKILDPAFNKRKTDSTNNKASWLDSERKAGRTSDLD